MIKYSAENYSEFVSSRAKAMGSPMLDLLHGAVGLSGEAGELLDSVKKSWVYGRHVDEVNIMEECGDALFYIQMVANTLGISIEQMMEDNIRKLELRYPSKYTDEAALARADKAAGQ